ncbi:MAG: UDP-2,3-diacylglucosamine diphosphatase [Pseudomonadales bacterium]|nr:UDP-2,3-diacylglucosamine diphosphatase [Pseudomonadales bacterium]
MRTLFISDLHLQEQRPEITRAFFAFIDQKALEADALYILGDFFEVWVGDDGTTSFQDEIIEKLNFLSQHCQLFFMHGNRDFLVGSGFAERANISILEEPTLIQLNNENCLLLHGDSLCTQDHEYIKFRTMVRASQWQQAFLAKPLTERQAIARQLRETSKSETANKDTYITDVTQTAVDAILINHNCLTMIHGHTHRPDHHVFDLTGNTAHRWVLGDWSDTGWYIEATEKQGILLHRFIP